MSPPPRYCPVFYWLKANCITINACGRYIVIYYICPTKSIDSAGNRTLTEHLRAYSTLRRLGLLRALQHTVTIKWTNGGSNPDLRGANATCSRYHYQPNCSDILLALRNSSATKLVSIQPLSQSPFRSGGFSNNYDCRKGYRLGFYIIEGRLSGV